MNINEIIMSAAINSWLIGIGLVAVAVALYSFAEWGTSKALSHVHTVFVQDDDLPVLSYMVSEDGGIYLTDGDDESGTFDQDGNFVPTYKDVDPALEAQLDEEQGIVRFDPSSLNDIPESVQYMGLMEPLSLEYWAEPIERDAHVTYGGWFAEVRISFTEFFSMRAFSEEICLGADKYIGTDD